jgi:hypothetical protein
LVSFLNQHPEVARNPSFYVGEGRNPRANRDPATEIMENVLGGLAVFAGFGMAIGLLVWLTRTLVDYKRWSRLARVQTDVHTKLLDRFTANHDLLSYIKSPAGPIALRLALLKVLQRSHISCPPARDRAKGGNGSFSS